MIAALRGKVLSILESTVIVDVSGVGYLVSCTPAIRANLEIGKEVALHTAMVVREDSFTLFGFSSLAERELFQLLQTVSGIGPKVAFSILSSLRIDEVVQAINLGDTKVLEKVSGLGKKGAQRIILDLKEKIQSQSFATTKSETHSSPISLSLAQALTGLGFNAREIDHALEIVKEAGVKTLEESLKIALGALHGGATRG